MWYDPLFSGSAAWFGVPAVLGTGFFTLRTALGFLGVMSHGDVDSHGITHGGAEHGGDGGGHDGHVEGPTHHHPIVSAAEVFSIQSLAAFAGAFGWAGLIARESLGSVAGTAAGLVAGAAMSGTVIWVFRQIRKLESDGTITMSDLLGEEGTVYVGVPERGRGMGQVRVQTRGMERIVNATSRDAAISTGGRVLVVAASPDNSVVVQGMSKDGELAPVRTIPAEMAPEKGET